MVLSIWHRGCLFVMFMTAACRYWLLIFPYAQRVARECVRRANAVPGTELREAALRTLLDERGNLDGAAAFAAHAPRRYRRPMIEALVSFQAIYDFADTLAERDVLDAPANAQALHQALMDTLSQPRRAPRYYAHCDLEGDAGYLDGLVDCCRRALARLPSYAVVERPLRRAVRRMVEYQTLIHGDRAPVSRALAGWARCETPAGSGLWWWETAAAGASSLVAFALIAAAARPGLTAREVAAVESAYFPWFGALHVLLDSLVDYGDDAASGHHSLVAHYRTPHDVASRMAAIGAVALRSAERLPDARQHTLLLIAMTGFYLARPSAHVPHAAETTRRLIRVLGCLARPAMLVHRARRCVQHG